MWRGISDRLQLGDPMRIVLPEDRPKHEMSVSHGAIATLSPVLKTDREFFEKGLEEMSLQSRFARFGQGVGALSAQELDYLTDVDQRRHVAWGAAIDEEAAGVGRYIASEDGTSAEFAITVIDHMQRRGVGTALLIALAAVARSDGIRELCFEARSDNEAVRRMIGELEITPLVSGDVIERRIRLSDLPPTPDDDALVAVIDEVRGKGVG